MRVVTVIAAVGSGVLATVLSVLLAGTAATASTSTSTGSTATTTPTTQNTRSNDDQLQAPTTTPSQTSIGGGHASSGGT